MHDVTLDFSRPEKPTDNGFIEAFNSKLRAECLNVRRHCCSNQWRINGNFMSLADARDKLEDWRRHDNEDRPHSAIGYNVPIAIHYPDGATSPSSGKEPEKSSFWRSKLGEQCCRHGLTESP